MTSLWLWVAFIGMIIGAIIFGFKAVASRRKEGMEFPLASFFITLWAATMYLTMILGSTVTTVDGQEVYWGRYTDWIITTPLLLIDLGVIAGARPKLIAGIVGADIFMIITGALGSFAAGPVKYLWYIISCGAFIAILWGLAVEYSNTASRRQEQVYGLFKKLRNILAGLWFFYPIVWILGVEGIGLFTLATETFLYAVLDISAKVIYGFVLTSASDRTLAHATDEKQIQAAIDSYMGKDRVPTNI